MKALKPIILILAVLAIAFGVGYGADRLFFVSETHEVTRFNGQYAFFLPDDVSIINDAEFDGTAFQPYGEDPWFSLYVGDREPYSVIRLKTISPAESDIPVQIFYTDYDNPFSEANSVGGTISQGADEAEFVIPNGTYPLLRFDIDKNLNISQIEAGNNIIFTETTPYSPNWGRIVMIGCAAIALCLIVFLLIKKHLLKSIKK